MKKSGPLPNRVRERLGKRKKERPKKRKKVVDKGEWVTYNEKARRRGGAVVVSI